MDRLRAIYSAEMEGRARVEPVLNLNQPFRMHSRTLLKSATAGVTSLALVIIVFVYVNKAPCFRYVDYCKLDASDFDEIARQLARTCRHHCRLVEVDVYTEGKDHCLAIPWIEVAEKAISLDCVKNCSDHSTRNAQAIYSKIVGPQALPARGQ